MDKQYVDSNPAMVTSGSHSNSREAFDRVDLPPGRYIIIPSSLKPKEEGEFLLRIFTETAARWVFYVDILFNILLVAVTMMEKILTRNSYERCSID